MCVGEKGKGGVRGGAAAAARMQALCVIAASLAAVHLAVLVGFLAGADHSRFGGGVSCFRAERSRDATSVVVYVGDPPKRAVLRLRIDSAAGAGRAVFVVSRRVFQRSETVAFASSDLAHDSVVVSSEGGTSRRLAVAAFLVDEAAAPASTDGVLVVPTGGTLELRGDAVCLSGTRRQLPKRVFVAEGGWLETDVGVAGCHGGARRARLFPREADDEARWLGLLPSSGAAQRRRADVERGVGSLENVTSPSDGSVCMREASEAYAWHCIADSGDCMEQSSVVFRRHVGHDDLVMSLGLEGGSFDVQQGPSGYQRLALSHDTEAVDAFVRLFLVLLAAAVTILRRRSKSINVRSHVTRAVEESSTPRSCTAIHRVFTFECPLPPDERARLNADLADGGPTVGDDAKPTGEKPPPAEKVRDVKAEAVVGMLAIAGRAVAITMSADLVSSALLVSEAAAIVSSALHLTSRHPPVLAICDSVSPVSKLGGSMASNDVASALLVSLAQTPFSDGFRPVGRLLAVSLISLTCLSQSMFAVVSMSLVAFSARSRGGARRVTSVGYRALCAFAGLLWSVELFAAGYLIAELFSAPFAADLHRASERRTLFTQLNLSLVSLLVSAPMRNRIVRSCHPVA